MGVVAMKQLKPVFAILLSMVIFSVTIVISALSEKSAQSLDIKSFYIPAEYLSEVNPQVRVLDDDNLVFVSNDIENTIISQLSLFDGTLKKSSFQASSYEQFAVDKYNNIYVLYEYIGEGQSSGQLAIYGVTEKKSCVTNYSLGGANAFEFDNNNALYITNGLNKINKCEMSIDRGSLKCETISTYEDSNGRNILSISKAAADNEIYFTIADGTYSLSSNKDEQGQVTNSINKLLSGEFNAGNSQGLKHIGANLVVDAKSNLYLAQLDDNSGFTKEIKNKYKSFVENMALISCSNNKDVVICLGKILYLLDDNGTAIAQCELENIPENIFCMGESIVAVSYKKTIDSTTGEEYTAQVDVVPMTQLKEQNNISYQEFTTSDNVFVTQPQYEISLSEAQTLQNWNIFVDADYLSATQRGLPTVEITDKNTQESFMRSIEEGNLSVLKDEKSISFVSPENIQAHEYEVLVKDLVNKDGLPASCRYTITVVDAQDELGTQIESDIYSIDRNSAMISNIVPGTSLSEFKSKLKYNGELVVKSMQGNIISSGSVGSGSIVELYQELELVDSLTVLIYGDIDGNGKLSSNDIKEMSNYILEVNTLNSWQSSAMDVNHDGKNDLFDLVIVNGCLNGRYSIEQQ